MKVEMMPYGKWIVMGMKRTDMVDREVVNFDLWSLAFEHTDD